MLAWFAALHPAPIHGLFALKSPLTLAVVAIDSGAFGNARVAASDLWLLVFDVRRVATAAAAAATVRFLFVAHV